MFSRISAVALLALPLLPTANGVARGGGGLRNECNTGVVQCCNQVGTSKTLAANNKETCIGYLLSVVVAPATTPLAVGCTPVSVLTIAGKSCTGQPVCCTSAQFNGLVKVGCTPVNTDS